MTAEELPDASGFSFDEPEGAKNGIYRYYSGKERLRAWKSRSKKEADKAVCSVSLITMIRVKQTYQK